MLRCFFRLLLAVIVPGLLFTFSSCKSKGKTAPALYRLTPVKAPHGWGYKITYKGRPFIFQEYIPAVQGFHTFSTREDALRTGGLVLQKLRQQRHPAVSRAELDSMHIQL